MGQLFRDIRERLTTRYDKGEAQAIALMLIEETAQLSRTEILTGMDDELRTDRRTRLESCVRRLEQGEPIQYVLGSTQFCGMDIMLTHDVLIPRPETEELVSAISNLHPRNILDIGTGSGCIALAMKKTYPESHVTAFDISEKALTIAAENARRLGLDIEFEQTDILTRSAERERWDLIVSNPPYICQKEKADMETNVLEYEPHLALFIPDDDPILFYRAISKYAFHSLAKGGTLAFETNRLYAKEVAENMRQQGIDNVETMKDSYGNDRIVIGRKSYE